MMSTKEKILKILSSSKKSVSGEGIAGKLGISRTSIWKHIKELKELGYEFEAVSNQGYSLISSPDRLFDWELATYLKTKSFGKNYFYYDNLDSTMDTAARMAMDGCEHGTVVCAETQTKGRGRLQREWISKKYQGIYFSLVLRPELPLSEVSKLTLIAGLAVLKTLKQKGLQAVLKWPNDILVDNKKICGILTELNAEPDRVNFIIAGIGININNSQKELLDTATSIYATTQQKRRRVEIFADVLEQFEIYYNEFIDNGFESLRKEWVRNCGFWGQRVKVITLSETFEGTTHTLDKDGTLLIRTDIGEIKKVITGDVQRL